MSLPQSSLAAILADHNLAALGDAFINFVYSLALSTKKGVPDGKKVKGSMLAEALRRAGLREYVPSSVSSHMLADAAEALLVYAWLQNCLTLEESVATLEKNEDFTDGLSRLLLTARNRIKLS
jgi:hypothetical protein